MIKREIVEEVIGKTFADKLDQVFFDVSPHLRYSRRTMVTDLNCANFIAAVKLAKVLHRLKIRTVANLYKLDPFSLARTKGIGETTLFVATCILDANGYDVAKWWGWKQDNVVKFSTFKHHAVRRATKRKQAVV